MDLSLYAGIFDLANTDSDDDEEDLTLDFSYLDSSDSGKLDQVGEESQSTQPTLNLSQDSEGTDFPDTPASSQSSLGFDVADICESQASEDPFSLYADISGIPPLTSAPPSPTDIAADRVRKAKDRKEKTKASKRLFLYEYVSTQFHELKRRLDLYLDALSKDRDDNSCWLYSGPRLPKPPNRTIRIVVTFRHQAKQYKVDLNIGFISLLLEGVMTEEQKEGIIEHEWHASHLCGNWTCLNWRHIQPEGGLININRNSCFAQVDKPCEHSPPCLKHLKVDRDVLRPVSSQVPASSQEEN